MEGEKADVPEKKSTVPLLAEGEWVYPRVAEFYRGKTIAITGGTGSLGQVLVEKLLRCCPQLKKIILFLRAKKDVEPCQRLKNYVKGEVFDVLRKSNPEFAEKLTFVACDLEEDDLGLSASSKIMLLNEVDILIHSAANLKFNENLRLSFVVNVQCVRRLLKLCMGMSKLKAFVHVSTAYSHCHRANIEEKFYDSTVNYIELESTIKCLDDNALEKITPHLLGKSPNVYTLTKAMSEDVIRQEGGDLPICVIRPSMIVPSWKEPVPGWCTSVYGPTAFFVAYAKGVLKSAIADENVIGDLIPVDLVVNGIVTAAMKTACDFTDNPRDVKADLEKGPEISFTEEGLSEGEEVSGTIVTIRKNIPIYHITSGSVNPLYISKLVKVGKEWYDQYPLDPHRLPSCKLTCNRYIYKFNTFFHQTIPAYVDDFYLTLINKERIMKNINKKIIHGMEMMEFFFTNEWHWSIKNTNSLRAALCSEDQEIFEFDARCFDWKSYLKDYIIGTRKYLVKQDMDGYPAARRSLERLRLQNRLLDYASVACLVAFAASSGIFGYTSQIIETAFNVTASLF